MKRLYISTQMLLAAILSGLSFSAIAQTSTYNYTSAVIQTYTVPAGVSALSITASGAQGGDGAADGGHGAIINGTVAVSPGDVLHIIVGQQPGAVTACGGGGGGTFVWDVTSGNTLLIAAGGGGGGGLAGNPGIDASTTTNGTNGGGGATYGGAGTGGHGATAPSYTAYGAGGAGWLSDGNSGVPSSAISLACIFSPATSAVGGSKPLSGGAGGSWGGKNAPKDANGGFGGGGGGQGGCPAADANGAGGGGGYSGGGGGAGGTTSPYIAGGGGGSYCLGAIVSSSVANTGNGQVVIGLACSTPGTITGPSSACLGSTTTLSDPTGASGGTWSSSNTFAATVDPASGTVRGLMLNTAVITYNVPSPCGGASATMTITVNPTPDPISGATAVCASGTTNLTSSPTGGTWSSNNISFATVSTGSGVSTTVTGVVSPGSATISYTLPSGCAAATLVTVNSGPSPITGNSSAICAGGGTMQLSDASTGGTWASSSMSFATVSSSGPSAGLVTGAGASQGTATLSYTLTAVTGCRATTVVTVNALPSLSIVTETGGNSYCAGTSSNIHIGLSSSGIGFSYQLMLGSAAVDTAIAGTGGPLNFGVQSTPGIYTVIATDTTTLCSRSMIGSASITMTPLPTIFTVSADGDGSYCEGSLGDNIRLSNSTSGVSYNLYDGGASPILTIGGTTGDALNFGFEPAGSYTVIASDGTPNHCSSTMAGGPVTVTIKPVPVAYNLTVTNGGVYCSGSAGVHVGLDYSNAGVSYSLYDGAALIDSVAGSNSGLDFGPQTAGSYTAIATNAATGCTSSMAGTITVSENYAPTPNSLTGGGNYCAGGAGVPVGVSSSDIGAQYQLYNGALPIGSAVAGTGAGFDFGTYTSSGTYTVTGVNLSNGCRDTMPGSATIAPGTLPLIHTVMGGGGYCDGDGGRDISVNGGEPGVTYQLYLSPSPVPVSTAFASGGTVDFGNFTTAGIYTVVAGNGSCTSNMSGSAAIVVNPAPVIYAVTGTGGYCPGQAGRHVGLSSSDAGVSYQLSNGGVPQGSPVAGSGTGLDFGLLPSGSYTVIGTNAVTGCSNSMSGGADVNINALPNVYGVTGGGDYCAGSGGEAIGLAGSDGNANYQLYRGATPVGSAVPGDEAGGGISFGLNIPAGTYTVAGTNPSTGCTSNMAGNAIIIIDPLPNIFNLTGGGSYCTGGLGVSVSLSGSNTGINYQLWNAGSLVSTLSGTGFSLNFGLQAGTGSYSVQAVNAATNCAGAMTGNPGVTTIPLPAAHNVTGTGGYCMGTSGTAVGLDNSDAGVNYQLYLGGTAAGGPITGSGTALNFGLRTSGTYTIIATNPSTTCSGPMAGSAVISPEPLPNVYSVSGTGAYCAGTAGTEVFVSPSDGGVSYQLYRGGVFVSTVPGGGAADFGPQTTGVYTVVASYNTTHCTANMAGSAIVTENTISTYTVIGGGSLCEGGVGIHIGQSGSAAGNSYQLLLGGVAVGIPVAGTGTALDFGANTSAGIYTVMAANPATGCTGNMAGTGTIVVNAVPDVHNVSGSGSFCAGTGSDIHLDGSNIGVNYQLYNAGTPAGAIMPGTGSAIDFGVLTGAGNYKAIATNAATGCINAMGDSALIIVLPLPAAYTLTAENYGNYCADDSGVHINLSGSAAGVNYQLFNGGTPVTTASGTGSALDFGLQVVAGSYTVTANDPVTTCSNAMGGGAHVYIIPLPVPHNVTGGGGYCPGGAGVEIGLDGSQPGIFYQLYDSGVPVGDTVYGSGGSVNFGLQPEGAYTVVGKSQVVSTGSVTTCPNPMFGTATAILDTPMLPVVTLVSYPALGLGVGHIDSMKVFVTNGGTDPEFQWTVNGNAIPGATSETFTDHGFFNNDLVQCNVTANGPCVGLTASKSIVLTLHTEGVSQVASTGGNILLVPNPNKGIFTVKGTLGTTTDEEVTLEVTNMLGQVVYTNKATAHAGTIDEQIQLNGSLANGMYMLTLRSATQNSVVHFVIEQ